MPLELDGRRGGARRQGGRRARADHPRAEHRGAAERDPGVDRARRLGHGDQRHGHARGADRARRRDAARRPRGDGRSRRSRRRASSRRKRSRPRPSSSARTASREAEAAEGEGEPGAEGEGDDAVREGDSEASHPPGRLDAPSPARRLAGRRAGQSGPEYEGTRHNVGFEVGETLRRALGAAARQAEVRGLLAEGRDRHRAARGSRSCCRRRT